MTEQQPAPSTGTVHWVGTGLSTGSGLRALAHKANRTVLWARDLGKARTLLARLGLADQVESRRLPPGSTYPDLGAGDVLVSMLPASEHPGLLRACLERGAHFACSSYVSEELAELAAEAEHRGLVVLTEAGLDPGLDHAFAHALVTRARAAIGDGPASVEFTSYCGGLPAVPNEFRYRFSWSPLGVLNALRPPARYIADGAETVAPEPWERTRTEIVDGERFEVYPNRDSLPFIDQYGLPPAWRPTTFVRGTLRLDGWLAAWSDVFVEVRRGEQDRLVRLAGELADRYPMTEHDPDRVVLAVTLDARGEQGHTWSGAYHLDVVGTAGESAMAQCVSLPLAHGVLDILIGLRAPGLRHLADNGDQADRCLEFLGANGLTTRAILPSWSLGTS